MLGHNQNNGARQKIIKENYQKTYLPAWTETHEMETHHWSESVGRMKA